MSRRPWMPMYWGDYLRDTPQLEAREHGAYLLLIAHYWNTGKPLPDDRRTLCRIARVHPPHWTEVWDTISHFFVLTPGSTEELNEADAKHMLSKCWRHKRIDAELEKHEIIRTKKQIAGAKGGRASRGFTNVGRFVNQANAKHQGGIPHKKDKKEGLQEENKVGNQRLISHSLEEVVRQKGWAS